MTTKLNKRISQYDVIRCLTGSAFKAFHVIHEMTLNQQKLQGESFDGWVTVSHNQLKNKTGVKAIFRVIDEFKSHPEIIEVMVDKGISNKYRINKDLW
jgi:hypothetical protein